MAIETTPAGTYRAVAKRKGRRKTKVFKVRRDAQQWEREILAEWEALDTSSADGTSFGDAMARYAREISPKKKGVRWEVVRLDRIIREEPIAQVPLEQVDKLVARRHMDAQSKRGLKNNSIIREMTLLKSVLRECEEWYGLPYPWDRLKNPKSDRERDRLITDAEVDQLVRASGYEIGTRPRGMYETAGAIFLFAIETAMRLGEICKFEVQMIDWQRRTVNLPATITKTDHARDVPLSPKAIRILEDMPSDLLPTDTLFGQSSDVTSQAFARLRKRCGVEEDGSHYVFHDTRHLACTRLARVPGMTSVKLARITGHRDPRQLLRYYNEDMANVADELARHDQMKAQGNQLLNQLVAEEGGDVQALIDRLQSLSS